MCQKNPIFANTGQNVLFPWKNAIGMLQTFDIEGTNLENFFLIAFVWPYDDNFNIRGFLAGTVYF